MTPYSAGSFLGAGNDVVITAGRDLNQIGSHITAGRDAVITVGQDWNMLASHDHETLDQYVKTVEAGISTSVQAYTFATRLALIESFLAAGKINAPLQGHFHLK